MVKKETKAKISEGQEIYAQCLCIEVLLMYMAKKVSNRFSRSLPCAVQAGTNLLVRSAAVAFLGCSSINPLLIGLSSD